MSQDFHNNNNITPDWDTMDMDWLNETDTETRQWSASPDPEPVRRNAARPEAEPVRRSTARPEAEPTRRSAPRSVSEQRPERAAQNRPVRQVRPDGEPAYRAGGAGGSGNGGGHGGRGGRGRRGKPNVPVIILIVILVIGMIVAGRQLVSIFLNYRRDNSAYSDLADRATSGLADTVGDGDATPSPEDDATDKTVSEIPFTVDWDYLTSINSDIVGWLYCANTRINYPVVQSSDQEYYLNHGFDGASNVSGALFVDESAVSGVTQSNYIIYGHNMKDESMFGTLKGYADRSYYEAHPTMYYLTPTQCYRVEIIAAHIVESTVDNYPGYFSSASDYQSYLSSITGSSFWTSDTAANSSYQLMTLSTCTSSSNFTDPRLLVQGLMIPVE